PGGLTPETIYCSNEARMRTCMLAPGSKEDRDNIGLMLEKISITCRTMRRSPWHCTDSVQGDACLLQPLQCPGAILSGKCGELAGRFRRRRDAAVHQQLFLHGFVLKDLVGG